MSKGILLLSRFEGHCCFALDYRHDVSHPAVVYIDESGPDDDVRTEKTETGDYITTLADSFESFLLSLLSAEDLNQLIALSPETAGLSYVEPDPI